MPVPWEVSFVLVTILLDRLITKKQVSRYLMQRIYLIYDSYGCFCFIFVQGRVCNGLFSQCTLSVVWLNSKNYLQSQPWPSILPALRYHPVQVSFLVPITWNIPSCLCHHWQPFQTLVRLFIQILAVKLFISSTLFPINLSHDPGTGGSSS